METDSIHLRQIEVYGKHGYLPCEKREPQPFQVDLSLFADLFEPSRSDRLDETFDYAKIEAIVIDTIQNSHFDLIERLADEILQRLFASFPRLEAIEIELTKPRAPLLTAAVPSVRLKRSRTSYEAQPVYLSLGSNLPSSVGGPRETLAAAINQISALPSTQAIQTSSFYESAPVGTCGPDFINCILLIHTRLNPLPILWSLQTIEAHLGRTRLSPGNPRTLDIDLIHYGSIHRRSPELTLPHPHWKSRAFVLMPLVELHCPFCSAKDLNAVKEQRIRRLEG